MCAIDQYAALCEACLFALPRYCGVCLDFDKKYCADMSLRNPYKLSCTCQRSTIECGCRYCRLHNLSCYDVDPKAQPFTFAHTTLTSYRCATWLPCAAICMRGQTQQAHVRRITTTFWTSRDSLRKWSKHVTKQITRAHVVRLPQILGIAVSKSRGRQQGWGAAAFTTVQSDQLRRAHHAGFHHDGRASASWSRLACFVEIAGYTWQLIETSKSPLSLYSSKKHRKLNKPPYHVWNWL